jgi:hypothetical protein
MSADLATQQRNIHLGLGEAIRRLIRVEMMYARGLTADKILLEESHLITDALNQQYQLDLGFDCNGDGIPDTVEIFTKSAETACCRLVQDTPKPSKIRGSSRESLLEELAPKKGKAKKASEAKAEVKADAPAAPKLELVKEEAQAEAPKAEVKPAEAPKAEKSTKKKAEDKKSKSFLSRLMGDE